MAIKLAKATGNWTAAGSWHDSAGGDYLTGVATGATVTTSYTESTTNKITPGAVTVDGIFLQLQSRAASPSGTFTVDLYNNTLSSDVVSLVVNVSDLPSDGNGWHFFNLGSQLLVVANAYTLRVKTSASSQINLMSTSANATSANWGLRIAAASGAAPAGSDSLFIMGEYTVAGGPQTSYTITQNENAATNYANIHVCNLGTLAWGTSANTELSYNGSVGFNVWSGGTHNWGTSGTRIATANVSIMEIGGNTGYIINAGGTDNRYGATRSKWYTKLSATANSAQAVMVTVDDVSADWAAQSWDKTIAVAATTWNTSRQSEELTISSISGTSITCTGNLTNQHLGTNTSGQDMRAHVVLLSRNNTLRCSGGGVNMYVSFATTANVNWSWAEMWANGGTFGSGTVGKRGVDIATTSGTCSITNCSFRDLGTASSAIVFNITSTGAITLQNNAIYNITGTSCSAIQVTGATTGTVDGNIIIRVGTSSAIGGGFHGSGSNLGSLTLTNNVINDHGTSSSSSVCAFNFVQGSGTIGTFSGNIAYCNNGAGVSWSNNQNVQMGNYGRAARLVCSSFQMWRNNNGAIGVAASGGNWQFSSCNMWGNGTTTAEIVVNGNSAAGTQFLNCILDAGATVVSPTAINVTSSGGAIHLLEFIGTTFGANQAYASVLTASFAAPFSVDLYGSTISTPSTGIIATASFMSWDSYLKSVNDGAVTGAYKYYSRNGGLLTANEASDTTHQEAGYAQCLALTPNIASNANDNNCEHWFMGRAKSGTAPIPLVRAMTFGSWNGKAYLTIFFKGQIVTGPTEITSSFNSSTYANASLTGSNPGENGVFEFRLTYSGTAGGLYLQREYDSADFT